MSVPNPRDWIDWLLHYAIFVGGGSCLVLSIFLDPSFLIGVAVAAGFYWWRWH